MRLTTALAAGAVIAVSGVAANAGGLQVPAQNEVTMITPMAPTGSLNSGYVVLGLLAALVAASGSF